MSRKAGKARELGINTDIVAARGFVTYQTILDAKAAGASGDEITLLLMRLKWQRLETVQRLFPLVFERVNGKLKKQEFRVSMCHRVQIAPFIEVHYSDAYARARYGRGLMLCGSPHICPVCKARITEHDRNELESVNFEGLGYRVMLVTLTLSHKLSDLYDVVRHKQESAVRKMRGTRAWRKFASDYDIEGTITSTENNFSFVNGWHVHKHMLIVYKGEAHAAQVKSDLDKMYLPAVAAVGGYASKEHGVDVLIGDNASMIAQYIAKWGHEPKDKVWTVQAELTKSPAKLGRTGESVTPDQLLDIYASGGERARYAGAKFAEYARGTLRKNRLVYSPGLRAKLRLGREVPDIEAAAAPDPQTRLLALLRREHWEIIERLGLRAWVIVDAARGGDFGVFQRALAAHGIHIDKPDKHAQMVGAVGFSGRKSRKLKR